MKKINSFLKRQKKIRGNIKDVSSRVRLSVFRSNKHIYAQLIDNSQGKTLISLGDSKITDKKVGSKKLKKTEIAYLVGEGIAQKSLKKNIKQVVFDRGGYKYHGRVKALSEGARKGGLNF